jgi:hypothetical protein
VTLWKCNWAAMFRLPKTMQSPTWIDFNNHSTSRFCPLLMSVAFVSNKLPEHHDQIHHWDHPAYFITRRVSKRFKGMPFWG